MTMIRTYSGLMFDLKDFNGDMITIPDIAHALSNSCRFNGHCHRFYSIAEHCVRASFLSSERAALHVLLHDASEAYMGDVVSPLKAMMPWYKEKEDALLDIIFKKYCRIEIDSEILHEVKTIDKEICEIEFVELWGSDRFFGWTPEKAKTEFLNRYNELYLNQFHVK